MPGFRCHDYTLLSPVPLDPARLLTPIILWKCEGQEPVILADEVRMQGFSTPMAPWTAALGIAVNSNRTLTSLRQLNLTTFGVIVRRSWRLGHDRRLGL